MGFINLAERTINAKLVYYGCGMGGKTSSLQAVHEIMCRRNEVQLVSIKTEEDATLLFDFLPIDLGQIEGFKVRIQGFTVPGQPKYKRMRKFVLQGADAVVFVVDSESSRLEENIQSLQSLQENLRLNGLDAASIPIVLQYNKRDLEDILPEEELDGHFKFRDDLEAFPSVATEGRGVFETFVHATGLLVEAKVKLYGLGKGEVDPAAVAEGARRRLWEISDRKRGQESEQEAVRPARGIELTFDEEGKPSRRDESHDEPTFEDDFGEVFTDDMLEVDLDFGEHGELNVEGTGEDRGDSEPTPELLDAAVESNLELARRYGELDRYKALLERKNRELVQATQNVVHDLNRPLSAIRLMFSSMKKGYLGNLEAKTLQAVENGLLAVHQMERLIRDLMDSSRLDHDGIQLRFEEVDLSLLIGGVINSLRYEIEDKAIGIRIEPLPIVLADEWALTKAFTNLLGNAIQYGHPDRDPRIWVNAEARDDHWIVSVRDNGIGIPESDIPRLFQRFQRGGNTGGISGTGLGLHIIRESLLGHGGDVWVESAEGEWTCFHMMLPFEPVQAPHSSVSAVEESSAVAVEA